jgi:hypothetical protein
VDGEGKLVYIF